MIVKQYTYTAQGRFSAPLPDKDPSINLVLVFGGRHQLDQSLASFELRKRFPSAFITGCSTSGEIQDVEVLDETIVMTTIQLDKTTLKGATADVRNFSDSLEAGKHLASEFPAEGLVHVLVLSDGLSVNGSELVRGLTAMLPKQVTVTGGLAGDADRFEESRVVWNGTTHNHLVAAIGWYGTGIRIGYGSLGGWDPFGPERIVTRSESNKLYELDGKNALQIYKSYLGDHARDLPGSALLFPLSLRESMNASPVVRTILSIDEDAQAMIFAGDIPMGAYTQLMKANFDRLIDGAAGAAKTSVQPLGSSTAQLALLISCVGRKMVLKQRIEEEVEAVRHAIGTKPAITGFYSYGEISPFTPNAKCELHNQTMTITTFTEN